jgi:ribulose-5-phosphate 4-epimerase/fuculose-1-phosphate aldolase
MDEQQLRTALCQVAYQLWVRGLVVADEGFVSTVVHRRRYLVTPSAVRRAELQPGQLPCVNLAGETVHGHAQIDPQTWHPHALIYRAGDDRVGATILIAPPSTTALLHLHPDADQLPLPGVEAVAVFEKDAEGAMAQALTRAAAIALRGTGILSAGPDLAAALNAVERVERAASIQLALQR